MCVGCVCVYVSLCDLCESFMYMSLHVVVSLCLCMWRSTYIFGHFETCAMLVIPPLFPVQPLDKDTDEYKMLEEYVRNTHCATHTSYTLEVDCIFKVAREGEEVRFKPFRKLHNRRLLWHGSRTTNYAGIISQGLRIAPPEAPSVSSCASCSE